MNVCVHGESRAAQGICQHTPGALRSNAGKRRQEAFGLRVGHCPKEVERQVVGRIRGWPNPSVGIRRSHGVKESLELSGALPLKSAGRQNALKLRIRRRECIQPTLIPAAQFGVGRPVERFTCLPTQKDEDRLRKRIIQVPEISGTVRHLE